MTGTREVPTHGHGAICRWIALLDRAEQLRNEADPHHPTAMHQVSRAIDSLLAYEHLMTPQARRHARERLWLRDHPDEALPTGEARIDWERCWCRACRRDTTPHPIQQRRAEAAKPTVWEDQRSALQQQQQRASARTTSHKES